MPSNDFSDDHVAEILKRDAKKSSIRYSTAGLQAFLPQRPVGHAPKPNTRFLRSIIRETDNHNAAILAKEAKDSRLRLKALQVGKAELQRESNGSRNRHDTRASHYDSQRHHRDWDQGELRHSKRRRRETDDDERRDVSHNSKKSKSRHDERYHAREKLRSIRHQSSRKGRSRSPELSDEDDMRSKRSRRHHRHHRRHRSPIRDYHTSRSSSSNGSINSSHDRRYERSKHRRKESRKSRHTSRSPSPDRGRGRGHSQQRQKRSRRRRSISSSPKSHQSSHRLTRNHKSYSADISCANGRTYSPTKTSSSTEPPLSPTPSEDSDPLAAFIGPSPPSSLPSSARKQSNHQIIRSKGRGKLTTMSSSAMDNHFAPNYNPSIDVHPDSDIEYDDWDQALEALRDRQRWRQQGADRLLAAGFTPEEIQKWQKGGRAGASGEKDEDDVRWAKMGEGREWDRGKVVDEDGNVELKAEWGRLKGT